MVYYGRPLHYISRMFFRHHIFRHFNRRFRNFATRRACSAFNRSFAVRLPLKCPLKWMRGQNPKFRPCSGRTAIHLAPLFFNGEENRKSKPIYQSLTIVVHGPQTTEVDALVYMWDRKILQFLANIRYISETAQDGYRVTIKTYKKLYTVYRTVTLPMTLSDL